MKKNCKKQVGYVSPQVKVVSFKVEVGFELSGSGGNQSLLPALSGGLEGLQYNSTTDNYNDFFQRDLQ